MARMHEVIEDGWQPTPGEVAMLVRTVGADLTRLHAGGAVHGGVSLSAVEWVEQGGFRLRPADPSGDDPWLREPPEVVDGDAPTPASDAYELAALTADLLHGVSWEVPESLSVAVQRGLRSDPAGRPTVTAFVVCATSDLPQGEGATGALPGHPPAPEGVPGDHPAAGDVPHRQAQPEGHSVGQDLDQGQDHDRAGVMQVQGAAAGPQVAAGGDQLADLRASLAAAAQEDPRSGLRRGPSRRILAGAAVAAGLLAVVFLWDGPSPEGQESASAQTTTAQTATESPSSSPLGQDAQDASPAAPAGADVPAPSAQEVEQVLEARAMAWARGDTTALSRSVVPGSPAWERDEKASLPRGAAAMPDYAVRQVKVESAEGPSASLQATAQVRVGEQRWSTVHLELSPPTEQHSTWRLVDWTTRA